MTKLIAIRIRGSLNIKPKNQTTLELLKLQKSHSCVVLEDNLNMRAMLKTIGHIVTWGVADEETVKLLSEGKKAKKTKSGTVYLSLAPPKGGFERKGIKTPFHKGGVLGFRGEKIGALVKKMLV